MIEEKLSAELVIKEIVTDCFLITHSYPWPANSLMIKFNQKDFLWIDTPYTPQATAQVLDWLFGKYGQNISITEVNTGFHIDNLGGNRELRKRDIPIYGSDLTCELLRTKSNNTMRKLADYLKDSENQIYYDTYSNFIFVKPTNTFDLNQKQTLEFGMEKVEIYYPGPTHTYDNLVVYIPGKKLLFGGCMVLALEANNVGFVDDGNLVEWPKSLNNVLNKYPAIEIVVPGHGNAGDKRLIQHTIEVVDREYQK